MAGLDLPTFVLFKVSREERRIDIKYEMGGEKLLGREYQTILSVSDISVGWGDSISEHSSR